MGGVGGWGVHSHYIVKPNLVLRLGWGFDNMACVLFVSSNTFLSLEIFLKYISIVFIEWNLELVLHH